jgi:hypothetical protein
MAGNINDFLTSFKTDLARPCRFNVAIPIPMKLMGYYNTAQKLSLRCESSQLPSVTFETATQKIYGPVEYYPYLKNYNECTLTFLVSGDMNEKSFFDTWMELINPSTTYDFPYKMDYATQVVITQYDVAGKETYSISLNDAFPVSVNQLDLDWNDTNSVHKLSVVFVYKTWDSTSLSDVGMNLLGAAVGDVTDMATDALNSLFGGSSGPFWSMTSVAKRIGGNTQND